MLVGDPNPHRPPRLERERLQALGQVRFEELSFGRVFFGVRLARNFQDAAGFSQIVISAAQTHLDPVLLLQPPLQIARTPPAPRRQARMHGGLDFRGELTRRSLPLFPLQEGCQPLPAQQLQPARDRRTPGANGVPNLLQSPLPLRRHLHGLQPLTLPRLGQRTLQRHRNFRGFFRSAKLHR